MIQKVFTYLRRRIVEKISIAVRVISFDFETQTSKRDQTSIWRPNILLPSYEAITIEHSRNGAYGDWFIHIQIAIQ